jgi:oxaloacetate decarboxylase alpha subunit
VISNLKRQLSDIRQEHKIDEVINEVITVRRELGYPIMITPFSQYVVAQAALNITLGERYKAVPEEVMKLAVGFYGQQAGKVDQNVLDKIMSQPEAAQYVNWEIPRPSIRELREQFGSEASDDELLLRILCQEQKDIEAMLAAGPAETRYPPAQKPIVAVIEDLVKRKGISYSHLEKDGISITLSK